jgi:hypothetical protein
MQQDNAARRLYRVLKCAVDNGDRNLQTYYAIARALDIQDPDADRHLLTDFFVLLSDVERTVRRLKKVSDLDEYIDAIKDVQSILLLGMFHEIWESSLSRIKSQGLIKLLNACANFIDHEQLNPSLGAEQLQEYLQECEALLQEVVSSDLPDDIKTFLTIRLEEICSAIRHYSIGGPERLRTVVEANIGGLVLRSTGINPEVREKPIFSKVFSWLLTLGGVLDLAANTQGYLLPKISELVKLLPPAS